jgi:phosphoribosylformylglycinamidine synthase
LKFGVIRFPGSCDDVDALRAARLVGEAELLWHGERDLRGADAIVVPGGFSYGDYLRAGAIAHLSPVMESVIEFAEEGGLVLGICNGFQVLCEARLLPGALLSNTNLHFTCRQLELELVNPETPFTRAYRRDPGGPLLLSLPAKHAWGRYQVDAETLERMREAGQIVLRYAPGESFNGSQDEIAGVCNQAGNVLGLMPHPEHAVDELMGSSDGLGIFESMRLTVEGARV